MKYPKLVPERVCTTSCTVYRTDGLNRDGSKKRTAIFEGKCFHSEKARQKLSAEKQLITLSGEALFCGDIAPDSPIVDGAVEIGGREYKIYGSEKAKNPRRDGKLHKTGADIVIKVTVKLDKAAIAKIEKAVLDSAQAAMEQVVTEVQNTAPLDQGDLINGIFVRSEKSGNTVIATIDHSALYSRYLYYGKLMIDPNTKSAWAKSGIKKEVTDKKLKFRNGRTDHWLEPYITGDKKDFVKNSFTKIFKGKTGV